jgi:hypothetical protein
MMLIRAAVLLFETFGTLFVWFDTERLGYLIQPQRLTLTDDKRRRAWRHNKAKLGFALLLIGIIVQCVLLAVGR